MCGRFVLHSPPRYLAEVFEARVTEAVAASFQPHFNLAPTTDVLGVRADEDGRILDAFRWGLIPFWAKDAAIGNRSFNARSESAATKPMFRSAFIQRRLIVPADGFYEWSQDPTERRQPYYFTRSDGASLGLAGLYETWTDPRDGQLSVQTCTILTTSANADLRAIHDRQPVILETDSQAAWLDPDLTDREALEAMCTPSAPGTLARRKVGRAVGRATTDGPELIAVVEDQPDLFGTAGA
jgi:putative SOS response-associated peptidase YedK